MIWQDPVEDQEAADSEADRAAVALVAVEAALVAAPTEEEALAVDSDTVREARADLTAALAGVITDPTPAAVGLAAR